MTTEEIARRLEARHSSGRWLAKCPAHDDRRPSLSLREGEGGKTLLHCFAGCSVEAIVAALGLALTEIFGDSPGEGRRPVRSTAEDVQAALGAELLAALDREEHRLGFRPPALTRLKNEARAAVERRFGVRLSRHAARWWEIEPHAVDPAWRACVDRATEELAYDLDVEPSAAADELARLPDLWDGVLQRARELQRELAAVA